MFSIIIFFAMFDKLYGTSKEIKFKLCTDFSYS